MSATAGAPTALVIGAAQPFGIEIAQHLAQQAYRVVAVDRESLPAGALPAACAQRGVDISDRAALEQVCTEVAPLDVLIVNVPISVAQTKFTDISDTDFQDAMQRSIIDVVAAVKAALAHLVSGARIVLVSSRGHLGAWGGAHLMAASAGVVAMARSMSLEFADKEIRVNVVVPDFVDSKWDSATSRQQVAQAVGFLAQAGVGVNGETMIVDGGRSLRMAESRRRW